MDKIIVRETSPNVFEELPYGLDIINGDVRHPWQITEVWTDGELAAEHIYRVDRASIKSGYSSTGYTFKRVDGVVTQVHTLLLIPRSVTPRQIRLALSKIGLRQQVEDYVKAQVLDVQDSWDYSTEFVESDPMIAACMSALGKTQDDLQALFDLAVTL